MASPVSRFWLTHLVVPAAAFAGLATLLDRSSLDLLVSDGFYDFAAGRWRHGDAWWTNELIHVGGRWLVGLVGFAALCAGCGSLVTRRLAAWRRRGFYVVLVIGLSTGLVWQYQKTSKQYCPRSIERYGGTGLHLGLLDPLPAALPPGRCFPAKHVAAGFSLFALYFAAPGRGRRRAHAALVLALGMGALHSLGQIARGAHFLSHCLWSAGVCWAVALALWALLLRRDGAAQPSRTTATTIAAASTSQK